MRFTLRHDVCCVSKLGRGEAKRVPRNPGHRIMGYYVGCPACARPQVVQGRAIDPDSGQDFAEDDLGALVSMRPGHECDRCGKTFSVERGEILVHV